MDVRPDGADALPEGEEQPPPGTRAMGIVRWALVALMAFAAASAWSWYAAQSRVVEAETRYHCPMHPNVVKAQKGECPICGMDLVPVAAGEPGAGDAWHRASAGSPRSPLYTCPMHPAFVTAEAAARCPECGMKLVLKEAPSPAAAPAAAQLAGLAPVELSPQRVQLAGVKVAAVARTALAPRIRRAGFVAVNENGLVAVTARFAGWIESVANTQTGQPVRRGDLLATIYSPDIVSPQENYINAARWSKKLPPSAVAATPVGGDLQRDARLQLELLGFSPRDMDEIVRSGEPQRAVNVRAPARGHVVRKNAVRGLYVTPGMELYQLADLSTVWVLADLYETDVGRVGVGQRASFEPAAYPGERIAGRVQFVYPALNPGTRTLQVRIELENADLRLRPGMFGEVTLELGAPKALVVPRDAVVDTGDVQYVFVAKGGGRFEPRRVRTGWSGGDEIAVLEGLVEGEEVVTTASFLVDSESRLRAAVRGFEDAGGAAPAR